MSIRPVGELALPSSARPEARHTAAVARAGPTHAPASFARVLHALGEESDHGESLVKRAVAGRGMDAMDPAQLLALQAGIYRYGEVVDLATRLVDRASTGAKTVLQGQ